MEGSPAATPKSAARNQSQHWREEDIIFYEKMKNLENNLLEFTKKCHIGGGTWLKAP